MSFDPPLPYGMLNYIATTHTAEPKIIFLLSWRVSRPSLEPWGN